MGGQLILQPQCISVKTVNQLQDTSSGQKSFVTLLTKLFVLGFNPIFGLPKYNSAAEI